MQKIRGAVLDLGSNSIKFMMGEQRGATLRIVHETAFPTRLAQGMDKGGNLKPKAIRDSLNVLRNCVREAAEFKVDRLVAVGTSALRTAGNANDLRGPARQILGSAIQVISGKKEGELVFQGISSNAKWKKHQIICIDIGGGSTEFIIGHNGLLQSSQSCPLGCVRVKNMVLKKNPVSEERLHETTQMLETTFRKLLKGKNLKGVRCIGSGGTMTALSMLESDLTSFDQIPSLEGFRLRATQLDRLLHHLINLKPSDLDQLMLPPGRADIVTTGAVIMKAALQVIGSRDVFCATRGLRYGLWQEKIAPQPFTRLTYDLA